MITTGRNAFAPVREGAAQFIDPEPWMKDSACRNAAKPEVFWPETPLAMAQRAWEPYCGSCPVRSQCLGYAQDHHELSGVWGGQPFVGGVVKTDKRPTGRPRTATRLTSKLVPVIINPLTGKVMPHRMTNIRKGGLWGTCSVCGPADIRWVASKTYPDRETPRCANSMREQARRHSQRKAERYLEKANG